MYDEFGENLSCGCVIEDVLCLYDEFGGNLNSACVIEDVSELDTRVPLIVLLLLRRRVGSSPCK